MRKEYQQNWSNWLLISSPRVVPGYCGTGVTTSAPFLDRITGKLVLTVSTAHQHTPHFISAAEATPKLPFSFPRLSESCCQRLCGLQLSDLQELAALIGVRGGGDKQEIAYRIANRQEPPPDQNVIRLIIKNTKEAVMKKVSDNGVRCA